MQVNSNTTASICLLKIQFSDLNSHFRSADFKSSQYAKGRRSVRVRSCGYFIVYAAQFLRSAHGANFVAVLVHILGILDMIGAFALYPAKAGDIDHIRQFVIVSYWLRCRSRLRRMYRSGLCLHRRCSFLFRFELLFYFRCRDGQLLGDHFRG